MRVVSGTGIAFDRDLHYLCAASDANCRLSRTVALFFFNTAFCVMASATNYTQIERTTDRNNRNGFDG